MKQLDPLHLRRPTCETLKIGVSTAKRRERDDPDFPKPVLLSSNRVAYRQSAIERYQRVLEKRASERTPEQKPAIATKARESAIKSVKKRAKRKEADRHSAASAGNGSHVAADVPGNLPVAAQSDSRHPAGAVGAACEARHGSDGTKG